MKKRLLITTILLTVAVTGCGKVNTAEVSTEEIMTETIESVVEATEEVDNTEDTETASNRDNISGNSSASSTPAQDIPVASQPVVVPESAPVTPVVPETPAPTPAPEGVADYNNVEPGQELGNTGITMLELVGGGEFVPTTDGYGPGVEITIEPIP